MIKYRLRCRDGHEFEAWFQNSAAFDAQAESGQVACPSCGNIHVYKAIMAPSVATKSETAETPYPPIPANATPADMLNLMRKLRAEIEAKAEYVGPRFAEEARRIDAEESPKRGIYGEASIEEVRALAEDGIPCLPLPRLPKDFN